MKKNYFYNLLFTVVNLLIPLITFPYVARVLGPVGVGKVQFIMTLGQYVALIAALGIPIYGIREVARYKHDPQALSRTLSELMMVNLVMGAIYFLAYMFIIYLHPFFAADVDLFAYAGILILLSFTTIDWYFTGMENFKLIAMRSLVVKLCSLVLLIGFVRDGDDTKPYLFVSVGAIVANNLINLWTVRKMITLKLQPAGLKKHFKPLFYIFGTTIASTMYTTFDSIILGFISGDKHVGLYTAASKISKISTPLIMAYGGVLIASITKSYLSEKHDELAATLNRSYAYITLTAIPISVCLFVFAPGLVALFSGGAFADAAITLRILSFLPLIIGMGYFWGYQVILPFGKDKFLLLSAVAGMVVSLILNFALVPLFNENGAAVAIVVAEVTVSVAYFLFIKKWVKAKLKHVYILQTVIACLPWTTFLFLKIDYFMQNALLSMLLSLAIGGVMYGLIQLFVFKNAFLHTLVHESIFKNRFLKQAGK